MHGRSFEVAVHVEEYLRRVQPMSVQLFKYLRFVATK